jgi:2-polyprenyl-6-methoxyphenol hydroxylase-like FAD-dependent oxidoreductase
LSAADVATGTRHRAAVIGGSMGGLFTAHLLRRVGWHVDVFERSSGELAGRGAGIVTHAELFEALRHAGIAVEPAALGVSVPGRRVFDRDGKVVAERRFEQVLTSWGRLYGLLRDALPADTYHHGKSLERVEESDVEVVAHFADGTRAGADLLVGADGLFSTLRRQFLPEVRPQYAGYVAWRGIVEEIEISAETRRTLCDWFAFSLPPGEQILGYPIAGANEAFARGQRRFNIVWYRPAAENATLRELLTDTQGKRHELSIPPDIIRPEVMAQMRADAERLLPPQFAEVLRHIRMPFLQTILDLESSRMVLGRTGRIAILGDAAFVARPHVGMGVTKAATDAAALAEALAANSDDVPAALAAFEEARLAYGAAVVQRARELGGYLQVQHLTDAERARVDRHRDPHAVMAETAVTTGIVN